MNGSGLQVQVQWDDRSILFWFYNVNTCVHVLDLITNSLSVTTYFDSEFLKLYLQIFMIYAKKTLMKMKQALQDIFG